MKPTDTSSTQAYANAVREMIAHEDDLLNNRMNWLIAVEGLLFSALAGAQGSPQFVYALIVFGFLIAVSAKVAFVASDRAIKNLLGYWYGHLDETKRRWQDYPPVFGAALDDPFFLRVESLLSPRKILPWAFALGWLVILFLQLKG